MKAIVLGIWMMGATIGKAGPTGNFMPLPDSPAIDYGLGCPAFDQRGVPRPIGAACDVGSVEYGWLVFLPGVMR
jgi:hypothetical protein